MRPGRMVSSLKLLPLLVGLVTVALGWSPVGAGTAGLRALIVGGGPEPEANQIAIERNIHYVSRLLPPGSPRITLFADGSTINKTVLYEEQPRTLPPGERAFALLFGAREEAYPTVLKFRAPTLPRLDGPARRAAITSSFEQLRRSGSGPLLLYFTGHGSRGRDGDLDNNDFDLWGEREKLSVRELAEQIGTLPPEVPVTLVMVQCFSGAFGNLIFAGGDPKNKPVEREIAGFFATTRERMSAGCTPELNEAEYQDFSSYFFAALSGRDRVGRPVTGADYNRDSRVGMDEAFAYSLIHDISIDVPVCTSDVFLRRVVPADDSDIFRTPYSQARSWATPAQAAALDATSAALKLTGEDRLGEAYRKMTAGMRRFGRRSSMWQAISSFSETRQELRGPLLERWPELRRRDRPRYAAARKQAIALLEKRAKNGELRELFNAEEALNKVEEREYQDELAEARVLRFVRLGKSVILAHRLRESGDTAARERFERLVAAESQTLLSPAAVVTRKPGPGTAREVDDGS